MFPKINKSSAIHPISKLQLIAKNVVEGFITGLHKSPFHGFSVEFAEHRQYNPGESTKNIDWKIYAKTERLFTKRYEEETNLRAQIVIDCSGSMFFPFKENNFEKTKIGFSIYAAASLIYLIKKQRDAIGLSLFSNKILLHTPQKSTSLHVDYLYQELEKISFQNASSTHTNTVETIHQIADHMHKRSLIILFSDMLDNYNNEQKIFSALKHLKYNKHEVILFHVQEPEQELNFNYENHPYKFIDLESKEEIKLQPYEIKEAYTSAISTKNKDLKLKCAQYNIDYYPMNINDNIYEVLSNFLNKRKKLH